MPSAAILNLYTTLEQLLEAVQCVDAVIGSASFDHNQSLDWSTTPAGVSSHIVTTVSQQTALHCSRLMQVDHVYTLTLVLGICACRQ